MEGITIEDLLHYNSEQLKKWIEEGGDPAPFMKRDILVDNRIMFDEEENKLMKTEERPDLKMMVDLFAVKAEKWVIYSPFFS